MKCNAGEENDGQDFAHLKYYVSLIWPDYSLVGGDHDQPGFFFFATSTTKKGPILLLNTFLLSFIHSLRNHKHEEIMMAKRPPRRQISVTRSPFSITPLYRSTL